MKINALIHGKMKLIPVAAVIAGLALAAGAVDARQNSRRVKTRKEKEETTLIKNGDFMKGNVGDFGPNMWHAQSAGSIKVSTVEDADARPVKNKKGKKVQPRYVKIDASRIYDWMADDKDQRGSGRGRGRGAGEDRKPIQPNNGFYKVVMSQYGGPLKPKARYKLTVKAKTLKRSGALTIGVKFEPKFIDDRMKARKDSILSSFKLLPAGTTGFFRDKVVYFNRQFRVRGTDRELTLSFKTPRSDKIDVFQVLIGIKNPAVYAIQEVKMERID